MKYEWDDEKYLINLNKHGVRFEDALIVFSDIHALEFEDSESGPETRIVMIGFNVFKGVLVVVYIEKTESLIRIISARKATLREEIEYEKRI